MIKLTKYLPVTLVALTLIALLLASCEEQQSNPQTKVSVKVTCPYFNDAGVHHRCYRLRLPSISKNDSINFDVPVVVFSQHSKRTSDEALVYIAGGPGVGGQTYVSSLEFWAYWYEEAGISNDLVIFNPRGLAGSSLAWNCEALDTSSIAQLSEDLSYNQDIQRGFEELKHCFMQLEQHLKENQIESRDFLKAVSAAGQASDVNFIVSALGYQHWHVWGASFGSRVAILAAEHAQVKSVVLDSVYPIEVGGLADWADGLNASMALWEDHYERSLSNKGGSFLELLQLALIQINAAPLKLQVSLSSEGKKGLDFSERSASTKARRNTKVDFVLNENRLKSVMFSSLYIEESVEFLIRGLQEIVDAENSEFPQLTLAIEYFLDSMFDPSFNFVYFWATECVDTRDDPKNELQAILAKSYVTPFPKWREWVQAEANADICALAFFDYQSEKYHYTQKPTLVFSGELDPVTPPHWGELAHSNIRNSKHVVVENATHGILQSYYCDWGFWQKYLESPGEDVSISCEIQY